MEYSEHLHRNRFHLLAGWSACYSKFKWDNLRCHNQDLVLDALDKRQIGQVDIILSKDNVYKFEPHDPLSKSTPSKSRMWQIPKNNLDNLKSTREEEDGTSEALDTQDWLGSVVLVILDFTIIDLLLEPTDFIGLGCLL
ncbi:hypothetical protein Tco_0451838 [Tanacetum coccineum]